MTKLIFFIFVFVIALLLLAINFVLAPHKPYKEKDTPFECGFHSFLQSREPFTIIFFVVGILFLLFDIEIILIYPYAASVLHNGIYGLSALVLFTIILVGGFMFELGKKALVINTKQDLFGYNIQSKMEVFSVVCNTKKLLPKKHSIHLCRKLYYL